jgi:predicted RecA/RadA family phage recombinase
MAVAIRNTVFSLRKEKGRCAHPKSLFWQSKLRSAEQRGEHVAVGVCSLSRAALAEVLVDD